MDSALQSSLVEKVVEVWEFSADGKQFGRFDAESACLFIFVWDEIIVGGELKEDLVVTKKRSFYQVHYR